MQITLYNKQNPIPDDIFEAMYKLLTDALPPIETRPEEEAKGLFKTDMYDGYILTQNGEVSGFMGVWRTDALTFIEHLAVSEKLRGQGMGGKLIDMLTAKSKKPVILEVELPETDIAKRRIKFYKRHGFNLNTYPYHQPPLRKGCPDLPLYVMSAPNPLSQRNFELVRDNLYKNIYKI